jgi:HSP20 family protein
VGDYQRTFRLSDEIDTDNINATVKDGVLRLYLPKAAKAKTKKISVQVV